jgi:hypothetical protein
MDECKADRPIYALFRADSTLHPMSNATEVTARRAGTWSWVPRKGLPDGVRGRAAHHQRRASIDTPPRERCGAPSD